MTFLYRLISKNFCVFLFFLVSMYAILVADLSVIIHEIVDKKRKQSRDYYDRSD